MTTYSPGEPELARFTLEPSVGSAYSHAWHLLGRDFMPLLAVGGVAWLLTIVAEAIVGRIAGALQGLYQILVAAPLVYGAAYAFLRAARGERPEIGDLFVPFQRNWLQAVLANLIVTVAVAIGFILLVIPGIYLAVKLSFVPFIVVDEGRDAMDAIRESWRRTDGYFWTLLGAGLLGIVIIMIGLILLVIGSIPATMLVYLAFGTLYAAITDRKRLNS